MKKIIDYVQGLNEAQEKMSQGASIDPNKVKDGVPADKNGTDGLWEINPKVNDAALKLEPLGQEDYNKNIKQLLFKFKNGEDFFIQGEAGWGKTSVINEMATRFGREVICVYLDKAVATDLGGIPIPVKGKTGAVQDMALPAWAKVMQDHPKWKFLLFFDEMNQAQPDVMNALMPIVLEHKICDQEFGPKDSKGKLIKCNFFVGAAGNFESENGAVNELSTPLASRFAPLITWETRTPEAWKSAFKYIRSKWGKDDATTNLISKFEDNASLFRNPREIEKKIIQHAIELKEVGDNDMFEASDYLDRLEGLISDDVDLSKQRTAKASLSDLADALFDFVSGKNDAKVGRSSKKKMDISMVPKDMIDAIKDGIRYGYIEYPRDSGVKYGISKENILDIQEMDPELITPEILSNIVDKFEADGIKWKFQTNKEWKDAGYLDPNED